jgi:O-antigen/teichoic acid export membrane protein
MIKGTIKSFLFSATSLKKNIFANFAGSFWQTLMGLLFLPLYIKYIGIESYGLLGVFGILQVILGLLDVGLGGTLTREMARLSVLPNKGQEMRNLVRTIEILYWCIAAFAGIVIISMSTVIAYHWINPGKLSPIIIVQAFIIMGFNTIIQMPVGFYTGGLIGLQKQILINTMNVILSTVRSLGALFILIFVSPTIQAFLLWQTATSLLSVYLFAYVLWNNLPRAEEKTVFQLQLLKAIWKFTAGMGSISVLSVILTQLDKVILSKLLSLEMFGYYSLASLVAMNVTRIFSPIFYNVYPRLTQLVSINDTDELIKLYHKSCQFIAVLVLPVTVVLALFSYEVIFLWTQNPVTAEKTYLIVSVMVCGTAMNGLMNLPYALQLAFGWTKLSVLKNIIAVALMVPLIIYLSMTYGALGAASAWLILNFGYILFEIPVMHNRLLKKEMGNWYWKDVCIPLAASISVAGLGRFLIHGQISKYVLVTQLAAVSLVTLSATLAVVPTIRLIAFHQIMKIKKHVFSNERRTDYSA